LVLQGHFGSFDLVMLAMGRDRGMKLSCIVKAPTEPWSAAFVERARTARGVELIPPRHSMDQAYRALDDGRVVIFSMDQRFNQGIDVPFLGHSALTGTGLAAAARRSRVPVFLVWQHRVGVGRHVMHVSPPIELQWTDDRDADITRATARFNDELGACVRERPHGWLWLHKRWRR
jgi:KDO2-lipid IV(A) lauroyltransferase